MSIFLYQPSTIQNSKPRAPAEQIKPRAPAEQIKPRAPAEPVPRKYELAPRFMKLKDSQSNPSPAVPRTPSPPTPPVPQELISSCSRNSISINNYEAIPPPRAVARPVPIIPPQPMENTSRAQHIDALNTASKFYFSLVW